MCEHDWDDENICVKCGLMPDEVEQEQPAIPTTKMPTYQAKIDYKKGMVRYFKLGRGFDLGPMEEELTEYVDVLLGRVDPPIVNGPMTLMELAEGYHARGKEIEMRLHMLEASGASPKNGAAYKFRTGFLRSFLELTKSSIELGSRRITYSLNMYKEDGR